MCCTCKMITLRLQYRRLRRKDKEKLVNAYPHDRLSLSIPAAVDINRIIGKAFGHTCQHFHECDFKRLCSRLFHYIVELKKK